MTDADENIAANDGTAAGAVDDTEGLLLDADNDMNSDHDDDDVEVIGEDQDYYDEDGEMTTAHCTPGEGDYDPNFYFQHYVSLPYSI